MTINIAAITEETIEAAAREDDLTEVLIPLQNAAAIDAGDLAGVFCCGDDKNDRTNHLLQIAIGLAARDQGTLP